MIGQSKKKDSVRAFFESRFVNLILVVLLVLSVVKVFREAMVRYEINKEIRTLENQLNDLESKSDKIGNMIAYLKTDQYIEKEARTKLNLVKPGEKQINFVSSTAGSVQTELAKSSPNYVKWFNYFFK
ncbi:MAG: septum formation initiator family protein [Patescibacteria group bacterium]|jgi:cell division protein FtsB